MNELSTPILDQPFFAQAFGKGLAYDWQSLLVPDLNYTEPAPVLELVNA
ncbi:hypothetical protein BH10ACT2_BH10ACT2_01600 [soil metagenome]